MNIMITSAGRRVGLIESLRQDARLLGASAQIIAVDSLPSLSAACKIADISISVPRCREKNYVDELLAACRKYSIRLLIPTIDTELEVLAAAHERFAASGVFLCVSSSEAVAIARDKGRTAETLSRGAVPTPATSSLLELISGRGPVRYPAVVKRVNGSRSIGIHFVAAVEDVGSLKLENHGYIAQEKCEGPEYTVNCYVDQKGALKAAIPHLRVEVRDGEVSKGVTERRLDLTDIARQIVAAVPGLRGPFCFQAILTCDGPKVFEINARFGGGYPLAHAAGATFGKWLMEEALGLPCTANDEWQDGLLMLRYDAAVFIKQ